MQRAEFEEMMTTDVCLAIAADGRPSGWAALWAAVVQAAESIVDGGVHGSMTDRVRKWDMHIHCDQHFEFGMFEIGLDLRIDEGSRFTNGDIAPLMTKHGGGLCHIMEGVYATSWRGSMSYDKNTFTNGDIYEPLMTKHGPPHGAGITLHMRPTSDSSTRTFSCFTKVSAMKLLSLFFPSAGLSACCSITTCRRTPQCHAKAAIAASSH